MSPTIGEESRRAFADERQLEIARHVDERGRARVVELAGRFGASMVTIRDDRDVLVDSSKWGLASATFCRLDALAAMIADDSAPNEMVERLEGKGVKVMQHG